ncbi:tyrosine-type recombinase/integrase [Halomonas alkaliantarctica]|nr:tyrosine-type recombinase/integrase [Halomonas alkaliantarctica]
MTGHVRRNTQLRQREQLLKVRSQPRQRFLQYVDDLSEVATEQFVGPGLRWYEVLDPESVKKENDPEYIEAFKSVMQGKTNSDKYGVTLNEVLQNFIASSEREQLHTEGTRGRFNKTVMVFLHYLNLEDIQMKDIERSKTFEFIDHSREKLSGATVQGHISRLKNLWEYAYARAWVSADNPFEKHKINTTKGRQMKQPFTFSELRKLLSAMEEQPHSMQLLTQMGLYTGARISELTGMKLEDFKKDEGVLMMGIAQQGNGKTKAASRWIPVPLPCHAALKKAQTSAVETGSEYLFHDLVSIRPDSRHAYAATKRFGVIKQKYVTDRQDKGFHSFRVMMATAMQQADVSELETAYLLGHSRKGLTMSYGYYSKGYDAKRLLKAQNKVVDVIKQWI